MESFVDPNLVLNLVTVGLALVALITIPRALRATRQKAELEAKDRVISTREQDNHALRDRLNTLDEELVTCRDNATAAEKASAEWQARYQEQGKYTAQQALTTIERLIESGDKEADRRHGEVMAALGNISVLVGDRRADRPGG